MPLGCRPGHGGRGFLRLEGAKNRVESEGERSVYKSLRAGSVEEEQKHLKSNGVGRAEREWETAIEEAGEVPAGTHRPC